MNRIAPHSKNFIRTTPCIGAFLFLLFYKKKWCFRALVSASKSYSICILFLFQLFSNSALNAQQGHCTSIWNATPTIAQKNQVLALSTSLISSRETITIPVVIHILWKEDEQNISEEQILSQIEVLNKAFQARPDNIGIVPDHFQNLIANVDLEFCLAQRDPQGNPTTGILRTRTSINTFNTSSNLLFNSDLGGSNLWNPDDYLNIYVANLGVNINGRGIFPAEATNTMDGIIINYRYFGNTGTALNYPDYNQGNTCVHEIGHYLNLQHVWGSQLGLCSLDDGINDTPRQNTNYLGECPSDTRSTCDSRDMYMNYMNYTNDDCLAIFTPQQKEHMLATLSGARASLKNSMGCETVSMTQAPKLTGLSVFPTVLTPTTSLHLILPQLLAKVELYLFTINGQLVTSTTLFSQKEYLWDLPKLKAGVYFLQVKSEKGWGFKKIIVL